MSKKFKYEVYFDVVEKGEGKAKHFTLIDNKGYQCGIFATKFHAIQAIPKIRRNIIAQYKRNENRLKSKQLSKK